MPGELAAARAHWCWRWRCSRSRGERSGSGRADTGARWAARRPHVAERRYRPGAPWSAPAGQRAGWRWDTTVDDCCARSTATRWSRSGRRSRGSRRGSRSRRCSNGRGRRSPRRSRPTCSARRSRRRQQLGEVFVFDPFELSGVPGQTWSPLRERATWDGALEVAWRLAAAGESISGRRGRRLLGDRRRAAAGAAAVRGGPERVAASSRSWRGRTGRAARARFRTGPLARRRRDRAGPARRAGRV